MKDQEQFIGQLEQAGIRLNEELGQHLLVDSKVLRFISNQVITGANVIEVGIGPGNLTEHLAQRANKVIGIEIDRRFESILDQVQTRVGNLEVIFGNALDFPFDRFINQDRSREWQVIGNIPYHISEPLLRKIVSLPIENAVLTLGDNLDYLIQLDNPRNPSFSRISFLTQTFFNTRQLMKLRRNSFYPRPRTKSAVIELSLKEKSEYINPRLKIQRELFLSESRSPSIRKVVENSAMLAMEQSRTIRSKKGHVKHSRRAAKQKLKQWTIKDIPIDRPGQSRREPLTWSIEQLELPNNILNSPFSRLSNQQIQSLAIGLEKGFEF